MSEAEKNIARKDHPGYGLKYLSFEGRQLLQFLLHTFENFILKSVYFLVPVIYIRK